MSEKPEPNDSYVYSWVMFYPSTWEVLYKSVQFYEELLSSDIQALESDPDLSSLIDERTRNSLEVYEELKRARRVREWMEKEKGKYEEDAWDMDISLSHGTVRYLKATANLYLAQLRNRRDNLASRPNVSRYVLETVDAELTRIEELLESGVFGKATAWPLLHDQLIPEDNQVDEEEIESSLAFRKKPRPVVISSIELLDPELRARCLDLFEAFREDGQQDRLDTVLTEATRILEHRLRTLSGASDDTVGVDLATFAFGGQSPRLVVSAIPAEQEAAHLIFRGVFGFVRNQVHHRLSGELIPDRVLQVLGLIDYLIALAQGAEREAGQNDSAA